MDNDRIVLHTIHTDEGATEVYWARAADDFLLDIEGSFLFHKDGTVTWKGWTDQEIPMVVAIKANRVVVMEGEDQVSLTEIEADSDYRGAIKFDSALLK
jgi:hypothetical protein